jgi:hypothetical protein
MEQDISCQTHFHLFIEFCVSQLKLIHTYFCNTDLLLPSTYCTESDIPRLTAISCYMKWVQLEQENVSNTGIIPLAKSFFPLTYF